MQIETNHGVGDLIRHKFQKQEDDGRQALAYEILEVRTVTCYAGTQVFYECRGLIGIYKSDYAEGKNVKKLVNIAHDISLFTKDKEMQRFRGDEIVECPKEIADLIRA